MVEQAKYSCIDLHPSMAKDKPDRALFSDSIRPAIVVLLLFLLFPDCSLEVESSQVQTLLRLQSLLEYPSALKSWNNSTDFCSLPPSPSLAIVCYEDIITQLRIVGDKGSHPKGNDKFSVSNHTLSSSFSVDSFVTTLYRLSSLKVLSLVSLGLWGPLPDKIGRLSSLEILNISSNYFYGNMPQDLSLLRNLQALILDNNMINGTVPEWVSAFPSLTSMSFKNNFLSGSLPSSLSTLQSLRVLYLSGNQLSGDLPDLTSLANLQELDLQGNSLGPLFPSLGKKLVTLILSNNNFRFHIPMDLQPFAQLQHLDLSFNIFIGLPPSYLFSLPSVRFLNLARNTFSGTLPGNLTCNSKLDFVDLSLNFFTGSLPPCLLSLVSQKRNIKFEQNCLATKLQNQHPNSYCKNAASATAVHPRKSKKDSRSTTVAIVLGVVGGVLGLFAVLGLLLLVLLRRAENKKIAKKPPRKLVAQNLSTGFSSDLLANARYISQTMRLGALGLPQYRPFALEELEEATLDFNPSAFMGERSHGKLYRGRLEDGTLVVIRCLKIRWRHTIQNLKIHLELLSKLRHRHLVSLLGHCIEYDLDGSTVKRIFLIFEYVSNGTLRSNLSGQGTGIVLTWSQRLAAAIGVARGIHFLHTGVVPGIFRNNLKITNVLLDQNLVSKLKGYNLPILSEDTDDFQKEESYNLIRKESESLSRRRFADKGDIYNFGLILLEIIIGRPPTWHNQETDKIQELADLLSDQETRSQLVDPSILRTSNDESLSTVIEITGKCLSKEPSFRPSIEDVLWNLQYAAQVQDTSAGDLEGDDSPENFPIGLHRGKP